jgi:hypothetical protein
MNSLSKNLSFISYPDLTVNSNRIFQLFYSAHAAPSKMVLGRVFAKWQAVLSGTGKLKTLVEG